jgi:hypothetical protein
MGMTEEGGGFDESNVLVDRRDACPTLVRKMTERLHGFVDVNLEVFAIEFL